jgi:hypothetical protein
MVVVMARDENRERDQNKRGYQAASPPTILFQELLFKTIEPRLEPFFDCFFLISGAT